MKDYSTDLKKIQRKLLRIEQLIKRENPKELKRFCFGVRCEENFESRNDMVLESKEKRLTIH